MELKARWGVGRITPQKIKGEELMFDDIKDAELSLKASVYIEEVVQDFRLWMTDLERIKKNPDIGSNVIFYAILKSVLSFGFTLYRDNPNILKKMVDNVFFDMTGDLQDHAES